jgi:lysophospholipase L1-like esterase
MRNMTKMLVLFLACAVASPAFAAISGGGGGGSNTSGFTVTGGTTSDTSLDVRTSGAYSSSYTIATATTIKDSGNKEMLRARVDSVERFIKTYPTDGKKARIVIYGSSTASGVGASAYSKSWAGLLEANLEAKGYAVFNASISGDTSQKLIDRFYRDVVPLKPDFVLIGNGIWNDGAITSVLANYIKNIKKLARMVENIGAIPLVVGIYPKDVSTGKDIFSARQFYSSMQEMGYTTFDCYSSVVNPSTGAWAAGLSSDGTHPVDVGHNELYNAIEPSIFDVASPEKIINTENIQAYAMTGDTTTATTPIAIDIDDGLYSFSVGAWVKNNNASLASVSQIGFNRGGSVNLRVRNNSGTAYYSLYDEAGTDIISSVPWNSTAWNHHAVTFSWHDKKLSYYVNGSFVGSSTAAITTPEGIATKVTFLARGNGATECSGCSIALPFIYRTALLSNDIAKIYRREFPAKSLTFLSTFREVPAGIIENMAWSNYKAYPGANETFTSAGEFTFDGR